ncbi:MAG: MOSC domain-containing protein [Candidatus Promineofilum sp.]|nr:MOSC domain-containing protein [Promineifilum sp.]MBP9657656.1 MOSC domain-containing protein [Promineifilum sp.]
MLENPFEFPQVFQINASSGGVPKLPLRAAEINMLGITIDDHNNKVNHGGPDKAICLFSLELIRALQIEGHPIFPGSTGENITIAGLDWSLVIPGLRLQAGQSVELEITKYTTPCRTIRDSFIDQNIDRISWQSNPGWARAYARVLKPGTVIVGDSIRIVR